MSFESFEIDPALLAGVRDMGFEQPTDIQQDAIPWGLEGRDVLACAMTGSGKTAAFGLPILQRLLHRPRGATRALILSPTRELASQIDEHLRQMGTHTGLRVATIYGGVAYEAQERAFRQGFEILVATPGRLLDHLRRPYAKLDQVEVLVLDEADRMLDMGFIPDVRRILQQVPRERQTMLFSATLPQPIVRLAGDMLADPVTINLERKAAPAEGVRQAVYPVRHELKPALLLHLLKRHPVQSALVFTRTRERADLVGEFLRRAGVPSAVIHGDRTQQHRTRAMDAFKRGEFQVLVATDVAARGIDIEELDVVVNLDVPSAGDDYIHRVGRTARAGSTGDAWTFVAARELADLHLIEKSIGQKLGRIRLDDFDYTPSTSGVGPRPAAPPPAPAEPLPAEPLPAEPLPAAEEASGGGVPAGPAPIPEALPAAAAMVEAGAEAEPTEQRRFRHRLRRRLEEEQVADEGEGDEAAEPAPPAAPAGERGAGGRRSRGSRGGGRPAPVGPERPGAAPPAAGGAGRELERFADLRGRRERGRLGREVVAPAAPAGDRPEERRGRGGGGPARRRGGAGRPPQGGGGSERRESRRPAAERQDAEPRAAEGEAVDRFAVLRARREGRDRRR